MDTQKIFDSFAALFAYPADDYRDRVACCAALLAPVHPDASARLAEFSSDIWGFSTEGLQELYIQTFDLNPVCSLEVGWHLFGENYDRGTFLVRLRQLLRRFEIAESSELPDHLSHVLALLGRMPAGEAEEFALACVFPALEKMRSALVAQASSQCSSAPDFRPASSLGRKDKSFKNLLNALASLLKARYGCALLEASPVYPELPVLDGSGLR